MYFIRSTLTAVAILGIVTSGVALAQTTPTGPGPLECLSFNGAVVASVVQVGRCLQMDNEAMEPG